MKNHLKRIAAPRTWVIDRKHGTFIVRPQPGPHALDQGLPLGIILRDQLQLAATMNEVKKLLSQNEVLVDGQRRTDIHHMVGLFDTLAIPRLGVHGSIQLDKKGRIIIVSIPEAERAFKLGKIVQKQMIKRGRVQYTLHDGRVILGDAGLSIGDSVILELPAFRIRKILPLKPGQTVLVMKGKHVSDVGTVQSLHGKLARYIHDGQETETLKDYLFVVGEKKPLITLGAGQLPVGTHS